MKKRLLVISLALLALCSCRRDREFETFTQGDEIRLQIGNKVQFTYDPLTCQMGFSRDKLEFRAHTDNMSDFFIVNFTQMPASLDQQVTADLRWTTSRDILTRDDITLKVVKLEGDEVWLWSSSAHIGVSIRTLE